MTSPPSRRFPDELHDSEGGGEQRPSAWDSESWFIRYRTRTGDRLTRYPTPEEAIEAACQLIHDGVEVYGIGTGSLSDAVGKERITRIYDFWLRGKVALDPPFRRGTTIPRHTGMIRLFKSSLSQGRGGADGDVRYSIPPLPAADGENSMVDTNSLNGVPNPAETTGDGPGPIGADISLRMTATLLLYLREQKHPSTHRRGAGDEVQQRSRLRRRSEVNTSEVE
jgi:hypothetical protein